MTRRLTPLTLALSLAVLGVAALSACAPAEVARLPSPAVQSHVVAPGQPPAFTPDQQALWAREEAYWAYVEAGDVESFRSLWDEAFVGWPCDSPTATFSDLMAYVGPWFAAVEAEQRRTRIEPTGILITGDLGITYLSAVTTSAGEGGARYGSGEIKITHTWRRSGGTWKILGGMCGYASGGSD